MKKALFGITLIALIAILAACAQKTTSTNATSPTGALSPEAELIVGTFKLEGTDLAVTAAEAKQLIPLWETLQSLATSNTAATEEINALVDQIKSTMTAQQIDKITSMKLTQQDMMSVTASTGAGFGGASGTPNATQQANQQFLPGGPSTSNGGGGPSFSGGPSGGGPSGAAPGGGQPPSGGFVIQGDPGGGSGSVPGQSATPQAVRGNGLANQVPAPLLNALIQMLQKKTQ